MLQKPGRERRHVERGEPTTDLGLLSRLMEGGSNADWGRFLAAYGPHIRRVAKQNGATEEEAWDILQRVMIKLTRQLPKKTYQPALGRFRNFLRRQVKWATTDEMRKRFPGFVQLVNFLLPENEHAARAVQVADPTADAAFSQPQDRETAEFLLAGCRLRLKGKVDDRQMGVFKLRIVHGIRPEAVAAQTGMTLKAVYRTTERVRKLLQREFAKIQPPGK